MQRAGGAGGRGGRTPSPFVMALVGRRSDRGGCQLCLRPRLAVTGARWGGVWGVGWSLPSTPPPTRRGRTSPAGVGYGRGRAGGWGDLRFSSPWSNGAGVGGRRRPSADVPRVAAATAVRRGVPAVSAAVAVSDGRGRRGAWEGMGRRSPSTVGTVPSSWGQRVRGFQVPGVYERRATVAAGGGDGS